MVQGFISIHLFLYLESGAWRHTPRRWKIFKLIFICQIIKCQIAWAVTFCICEVREFIAVQARYKRQIEKQKYKVKTKAKLIMVE